MRLFQEGEHDDIRILADDPTDDLGFFAGSGLGGKSVLGDAFQFHVRSALDGVDVIEESVVGADGGVGHARQAVGLGGGEENNSAAVADDVFDGIELLGREAQAIELQICADLWIDEQAQGFPAVLPKEVICRVCRLPSRVALNLPVCGWRWLIQIKTGNPLQIQCGGAGRFVGYRVGFVVDAVNDVSKGRWITGRKIDCARRRIARAK